MRKVLVLGVVVILASSPWLYGQGVSRGGNTFADSATWVKDIDNDESEFEFDDTAGCVKQIFVHNKSAVTLYVKPFLLDADDVTVGTTVPTAVFGIPAGQSGNLLTSDVCIDYTTGFSIATTTGVADTDTGAPAANDMVITATLRT